MKKFTVAVLAVAVVAGGVWAILSQYRPIAAAATIQPTLEIRPPEVPPTASAQPGEAIPTDEATVEVTAEATAAAVAKPTAEPTGESKTFPALPVTACNPAYVSPFGIDMYNNVDDQSGLPQMQAAGSRMVTTMLDWAAIEPQAPVNGKPRLDWSSFDLKVHNAQAAGMQVFVLFTDNPTWAAALPGGPVTNTQNLLDFVTAAVERYDGDQTNAAPGSPEISYWSFYAEPDNGSLWWGQHGKGYWGNNAAGYAQLLTQLTPAIHAINPQVKVLMGGLAYDNFTTDGGPFIRSFLPSLLAALNTYPGGAAAYLDAVAFHFYPVSAQRWPTIRDKAQVIQGIMNQYGAGRLPLVVPEMGYWSDPANGSSEPWQAEYLVQMYTTGLAAGIQRLSWFNVFDDGTGSETHGLFRNHDLAEPRPALAAYQTMTAELAGAHYLRDITASGVSGYAFSTCDSPEKLVVWGTKTDGRVTVGQSCVRQVDLLGNVVQITDGAAGDLDGATNHQVVVGLGLNQLDYLGNCR